MPTATSPARAVGRAGAGVPDAEGSAMPRNEGTNPLQDDKDRVPATGEETSPPEPAPEKTPESDTGEKSPDTSEIPRIREGHRKPGSGFAIIGIRIPPKT